MLSRLMTRREQLLLLFIALSLTIGAVALMLQENPRKRTTLEMKPDSPVVVEKKATKPSEPATPPETTDQLQNKPGEEAVSPVASMPSENPKKEVVISVAGAVNQPGVYHMKEGACLNDALEAAGGVREDAEVSDLNLAAILIDGSTLTVPVSAIREKDGGVLRVRQAQVAAQMNPPAYTLSGSQTLSPAATGNASGPDPISKAPTANAPAGSKIDLNTADAALLDTLPGIGPKTAQDIIAYRSKSPFTSVDDLDNVPGIGPKKLETLRPLVTVGSAP